MTTTTKTTSTAASRWAFFVLALNFLSGVQEGNAFVPSQHVFVTPVHKLSSRAPLQMAPSTDQQEKKTGIEKRREDPFDIARGENLVDAELVLDEEDEGEAQLGLAGSRALLFLIAVIWATNFACVKYLETLCFHPPCVHPPSEAALARFGVAAAVGLPLLVGQKKEVILGGLECGLWISLGYITQAVALSTIPSGKCAFICSLTVVVVPLLSAVLYGKPIKPTNLAAAVVALSGVAILEGLVDMNAVLGIQAAVADPGAAIADSAALTSAVASSTVETASAATAGPLGAFANALGVGQGDIVALGQPIGFGLAFMRIEHYVDKFKDEKNRVLTLSAAQCVTVGVVSLFWVLYDFHGTIPNMEYMVRFNSIGGAY
jgi:drug/metabolite transporter (DMT)-like permease